VDALARGDTPLIFAVQARNLGVVKQLIAAGADLEVVGRQGATALMIATLGEPDIVRSLIEAGAALDTTDAEGRTALDLSILAGNAEVIEMLNEIVEKRNITQAIERARDRKDPFRLMGFGHRVYKTFDPRMKIMKKMCDTLLKKLKIEDPLLDVAKELEAIALKDDYFVSHNLYPNVDFYSGIVLRAIGIPTNMFTVMFAIGRLPGWIAQWKESLDDPNWKLCRPRQIYTGYENRDYVDISQRS